MVKIKNKSQKKVNKGKYLKKNTLKKNKNHTSHIVLRGGSQNNQEFLDQVKNEMRKSMSIFNPVQIDINNEINEAVDTIQHGKSYFLNLSLKNNFSISGKSPEGGIWDNLKPEVEEVKRITSGLEYFNSLDDDTLGNSKILYVLTHSALPKTSNPYVFTMVPPNIMVCFVNPILHFGYFVNNHLFSDIPPGQFENRKQFFKQMFEFRQNTDQHTLAYEYFTPTTGQQAITNLKLGSWYYPGQLVPNVSLSFKKEEVSPNRRLGVYIVSYPKDNVGPSVLQTEFPIEEDSDYTTQIRETQKFRIFLKDYLAKYQSSDTRYVIYVKGCRSIPYYNVKSGDPVPTLFYKLLMERELFNNCMNRVIDKKVLNDEPKNIGLHLPLNYYSSVKRYYSYQVVAERMDYNAVNLFHTNFANTHILSRFNTVYFEILEASVERELTVAEIKFVRYNSHSKLLLFLLEMVKKPNIQNPYSIVNKNFLRILNNFNLVTQAFQPLINMISYILKLKSNDICEMENPIISNFLFDIFMSQTDYLLKLAELIQIQVPQNLVTKLFMTQENLKKLKNDGMNKSIFIEDVRHLNMNNQLSFDPDDFKLFPNLMSLEISNISVENQFTSTNILPQILNLSLLKIYFLQTVALENFISQFSRIKFLKMMSSTLTQVNPNLDLSFLHKFRDLNILNLENIQRYQHITIHSTSITELNIKDFESPEEACATGIILRCHTPNVINIIIKGDAIDIEQSFIESANRITSIQIEIEEKTTPCLRIFQDSRYICNSLQVNYYDTLVDDLTRFQCDSIWIYGNPEQEIDILIFQKLLLCHAESIDLINFTLQEFDNQNLSIGDLISIGDKDIKIRDSNVKQLEDFCISQKPIGANILFIDCD